MKVWIFSRRSCGNKSGYFEPKHFFQTLTKCYLCINLIRPSPQPCHSTKLQPSPQNKCQHYMFLQTLHTTISCHIHFSSLKPTDILPCLSKQLMASSRFINNCSLQTADKCDRPAGLFNAYAILNAVWFYGWNLSKRMGEEICLQYKLQLPVANLVQWDHDAQLVVGKYISLIFQRSG